MGIRRQICSTGEPNLLGGSTDTDTDSYISLLYPLRMILLFICEAANSQSSSNSWGYQSATENSLNLDPAEGMSSVLYI